MTKSVMARGWSLLDDKEKRHAIVVLVVVAVSAATSAIMVGSIVPFLSALANPKQIHEVGLFVRLYRIGQFSSDYEFLVALGLGSLAVIVIANVMQMLRLYLVVGFATMRMHTLSTRLLSTYLRQPYEYFLREHSGELGTQILAETQQIVLNFFRPALEVVASLLTIIAIVGLLLCIDPLVAITTLAAAASLYVGSFAISQRAAKRFGDIRGLSNRDRFRVANEALAGVKDLKLLGREASYIATYESASLKMANAEAAAGVISQLPQYVMQIVAFGGMIVLVLSLLNGSQLNDQSTMGHLLPLLGVFAFAGQRLIPELAKLYAGITQLAYGAPTVNGIYADLSVERVLRPLPPPTVTPLGLKTSLELRGLCYSYPNAETSALIDVSVQIQVGERIGIVGGSGSGKTTLADLIMGLLEVERGQIIVDGHPVCEANLPAWQRTVGYVQQTIFLSDASILENIALGVPKEAIDRSRAVDAARIARLDEFVHHYAAEGYESTVGERGVRLSGGQKQRIGIARALYNNADLIVFDEATSALDNITEKEVMDSVDALPGNKTVILIAHRLSTLKKCDRLIVLDAGRVVGVGTWAELLRSNEHFRRLAASFLEPVQPREDIAHRARVE